MKCCAVNFAVVMTIRAALFPVSSSAVCQNQQAVARTNSLRALFVLRTFLAGNNDCSTLKSIIVLSVCSKNFCIQKAKKISVNIRQITQQSITYLTFVSVMQSTLNVHL